MKRCHAIACMGIFFLMTSGVGQVCQAQEIGALSSADFSSMGTDLPGTMTLYPAPVRDALSPEQEAGLENTIAEYELGRGVRLTALQPKPYPFFPHAGTLWRDLPAPNYVDLDAASGLLDWDCSRYTYDGHNGIDTPIVSFRAQIIGVPIFAALDGVVVDAHDGESDTNTSGAGNPQANFVALDHGNTQYSYYYHMKRGSVAVAKGQTVVAGQPIGLTGSSGYSTWPHLHFASKFNGRSYEPHAGACRSGDSGWTGQVPIRRDPYAYDFCFSASGFDGDKGLPWDKAQRTGTFLAGNRRINLQIEGANLPSRADIRLYFQRPDGTTAADFVQAGTWPFLSFFAVSFAFDIVLDCTGPWRFFVVIDGQGVIDAPFAVVSSPAEIVNRPPNPVALAFDPPLPSAGDVLFCRVAGDLYKRDPDYDLVSYRYLWTANGAVVRDVTTAGMADALRRDLVQDGDSIVCAVTPADGTASGPTATVHLTVGGRHSRPLDPPGNGW